MNTEIIDVYKLSDDAITPFKGTALSACYDVCACLHQPEVKLSGRVESIKVETNDHLNEKFIRLYPDDMALIPTGMIFLLPETHHLKMYSRSGNVWKRLLKVGNQPAVIDSDYLNETFVLLHNRSPSVQIIKSGDAIAQAEVCKNKNMVFCDVNEEQFERMVKIAKEKSDRDGGFGHTDKKRE